MYMSKANLTIAVDSWLQGTFNPLADSSSPGIPTEEPYMRQGPF